MGFPKELEEARKRIIYGEEETMGSWSAAEDAALDAILSTIVGEASPAVAKIYKDPANKKAIIDVIREVKKETRQEFLGPYARGSELTAVEIRPQDVLRGGTALTTWLSSVSAGVAWFESGAGNAAIECPEHEGRAYIGFVDVVDTPRVVAIQLEKGGDPQIPVAMDFEKCSEYPVIQLPTPWKITPRDRYRIQVRYHSPGNDSLRPLGLRIATAATLISL